MFTSYSPIKVTLLPRSLWISDDLSISWRIFHQVLALCQHLIVQFIKFSRFHLCWNQIKLYIWRFSLAGFGNFSINSSSFIRNESFHGSWSIQMKLWWIIHRHSNLNWKVFRVELDAIQCGIESPFLLSDWFRLFRFHAAGFDRFISVGLSLMDFVAWFGRFGLNGAADAFPMDCSRWKTLAKFDSGWILQPLISFFELDWGRLRIGLEFHWIFDWSLKILSESLMSFELIGVFFF